MKPSSERGLSPHRVGGNNGLHTMLVASRAHRGPALLAVTAGLVNGATMVLGAAAIGWSTDHLVVPVLAGDRVAPSTWWLSAGAILGVSAFRWITIFLRGISTGRVQHRSQAATRRLVVRRYLQLDAGWHRRNPPGQLLAHAISDVDALWSPVQWFYFTLGMVFMLGLALAELFVLDVALGLIGLALVAAVLGVNVTYQRLLRPRAREAQAARGLVGRVAHDSIEGGPVVRSLGLAGHEDERFAPGVEELRVANSRMARISAVFDPVLELLPTCAVLAVLAVGAPRVASGELTVGLLISLVYLLLTVSIPLNVISRFLSMLPLSAAGRGNLDNVLTATELTRSGDRGLPGRGPAAVELHGAELRRDGVTLVHPLDLVVAPGSVTAVVGATGSGKTTLLDVISGQVPATSGQVLLDGVDVSELEDSALAASVAIVSQAPFLFAESVRDNLTLEGHPHRPVRDYAEEDLWRALHMAAADDMVRALPQGLDTVVGERGATLSGGQRQRLCLARALIREPRLLVLDDATSALDPDVEKAVLARLDEVVASGGLTVLLVANRPASLALADLVLFVRDGRVVDSGAHPELLARNTDYREIVTAYDLPAGPPTEEVDDDHQPRVSVS